MNVIRETAKQHHLQYSITEDTNSEPRYCAEHIKEKMRQGAAKIGITPHELMSGPFHDSLSMSYVCDYGMIFVRCKDGISHNPAEYSSTEDIVLGTELLYQTTIEMITSGITHQKVV
ncbi:Hydantoin utilization protein C [compost metagenome]